MTTAVLLEGVSKAYRRGLEAVEVLAGVDLAVPRGALALVEGPSGSGKSTLLHLVGAMTRAGAGRITVEGDEISSFSEPFLSRFRREKVGFVFQGYHLVEGMTAEENVGLPLVPTGLPPAARRTRARAALERFGVAHRAGFRAAELSGGERQRVAIARAFVLDPPLLLADEPIASLDAETARAVFAALDAARAEGRTVIAAAHDGLAGLARPPDLILRIDRGRIAAP